MALIQSTDLASWMGGTLDPNRASMSIRIAEGWLMSATRIDPWPDFLNGDTIPPDLWAWCMQLAALCYQNNARQVTQRIVGGVTTVWAPDAQQEKEAILAAAKGRYNTVGQPRGTFDAPQAWPDPATPFGQPGMWWDPVTEQWQ